MPIAHLHATVRLRSDSLVHLDEARTVVDEHAVLISVLQVHPEDKFERLRFSKHSERTPTWTRAGRSWQLQVKNTIQDVLSGNELL